MKQRFLTIAVFAALAACGFRPAYSEPGRVIGGYLDFNYYYDTRDFNVFTINSQLKMTRQLEYFSFVNYFNSAKTSLNRDLTNYYTEQNLRWSLLPGIPAEAVVQYVSTGGGKNDVLHFGGRWRVSSTGWFENFLKRINMFYAVSFFPLQFDSREGYHWQIEHVYRMELFPDLTDKRLYLSGYADHNIGPGNLPWVTEHQLGIRLVGGLHAVSEYRHNGFL
ncbi:MAG: hypothetical protein ABIG11_05125, partial [bacterium]